eukprot:11166856-Lingulodinium_polyedra.AAC.1
MITVAATIVIVTPTVILANIRNLLASQPSKYDKPRQLRRRRCQMTNLAKKTPAQDLAPRSHAPHYARQTMPASPPWVAEDYTHSAGGSNR